MPFIALISLALMFAGVMYLNDARQSARNCAKIAVIVGAVGVTIVAMAGFGPMVALVLFAVFVAVSFWTQFWS